MASARITAAVALAVAIVAVAVAPAVLHALEGPRVTAVESEWGTVTEDRTEVRTHIDVRTPRLVRVGETVVDVEYTVELNDVTVARETKERVTVHGNEDTIAVSTWLENDQIPRWWVTHVERNETTTVTIEPTIASPDDSLRVDATALSRSRTFETDLLATLRADESRELTAFDRTVLVVNETDARWGDVTRECTPVRASLTITNPLSVTLPLTDVEYTIRMNDVVVGQGILGDDTQILGGETRTIPARAHVDNGKLDEWWVTHLRNDETTTFSVDLTATVEFQGSEQRLDLVSYNTTFHTDILGATANGNESDRLLADVESSNSVSFDSFGDGPTRTGGSADSPAGAVGVSTEPGTPPGRAARLAGGTADAPFVCVEPLDGAWHDRRPS